jgi:hypothetical protein
MRIHKKVFRRVILKMGDVGEDEIGGTIVTNVKEKDNGDRAKLLNV